MLTALWYCTLKYIHVAAASLILLCNGPNGQFEMSQKECSLLRLKCVQPNGWPTHEFIDQQRSITWASLCALIDNKFLILFCMLARIYCLVSRDSIAGLRPDHHRHLPHHSIESVGLIPVCLLHLARCLSYVVWPTTKIYTLTVNILVYGFRILCVPSHYENI